MRRSWIVGGALVAGVALAGVGGWLITQPMYRPGALATRADLAPEAGSTSTRWHVAPGVSLEHFSRGDGPRVLYIHGGPSVPPARPIPALDQLGDAYQVHYYAQRGCGDSSRVFDPATTSTRGKWANIKTLEGSLGIGEQVADVERIRRILGDEQLIIIGHSYGALLATLYAVEFPERVRALVLLTPASLLRMPGPHGDLFQNIRARLPASRHAAYDAWKQRYLDFGGLFSQRTGDLEALDAELITYWEEAAGPLPPTASAKPGAAGVWAARAQFFSLGMRHDYRPALARVRAPTLIIHGTQDMQPRAVSEEYRDAMTGAKARVRDIKAGHFLHHTHPAEVRAMIREHLDTTLRR